MALVRGGAAIGEEQIDWGIALRKESFKIHWQSGFASAQFVIIAVIIGLLAGSAYKGREMLVNARIKRLEADLDGLSAAIQTYQNRYGVLPGDDPDATSRFSGAWRSSDNGNGDGRISGRWNSADTGAESRKIWKHLRAAGLMAGPVGEAGGSYQPPAHSFGGQIGVQLDLYNIAGQGIVFGAIPGNMAKILEGRGDDGVPSTGDFQSDEFEVIYDSEVDYDLAIGI